MSTAQFWSLILLFTAQIIVFTLVSCFSSWREKEVVSTLQSILRHLLVARAEFEAVSKKLIARDGDTLSEVMSWTRDQFENLIAMKMVVESPQNAPALMQQVRMKHKESGKSSASGEPKTPPSPSGSTKEPGVTFVRSTG